ncbi:MAG TPA: DUF4097 family beta strand repeat-containing protein [Pyrinomonadaceae bacterium]|nr:DUF4097 family beta strand repeat-containing protein [Pyrinomonadaceae bacterium]
MTLCVASGVLKVRGWDKSEIRVRSLGAEQVEFRRIDRTKDTSKPATRVDVMVLNKAGVSNPRLDCQAFADVDMEVPLGATVQVQTRDGDIMISGVSGAYAGSQSGDITIERATKLVEAGSVGGSISLKDSSGRINLSSAGGSIEVLNIRAADAEDTFEVGTVSGDIQLDRVSIRKVTAKTVNGTVTMTGPLAKSGWYGFTNMTGDIVLGLPSDASFQLQAKVSEKHDIISDFKLNYVSEPSPPVTPRAPSPAPTPKAEVKKPLPKTGPVITPIVVQRQSPAFGLRRINAICGTGDAIISVNSFGGTVRLKKI